MPRSGYRAKRVVPRLPPAFADKCGRSTVNTIIINKYFGRAGTEIVLARHSVPIRAGVSDGKDVADFRHRDWAVFGEEVTGFADVAGNRRRGDCPVGASDVLDL